MPNICIKSAKKNIVLKIQNLEKIQIKYNIKLSHKPYSGSVLFGSGHKFVKGKYLFIYRNDKWDLPKGKIEKGEQIKECAVREVEEECGIIVKKLGKKIGKTYHAYINREEVVLKKTHWFKMKSHGQEKLKPQKEEGITDVRWFKDDEVPTIVNNTFPSIIDVLEKEELITDTAMLPSE